MDKNRRGSRTDPWGMWTDKGGRLVKRSQQKVGECPPGGRATGEHRAEWGESWMEGKKELVKICRYRTSSVRTKKGRQDGGPLRWQQPH